MSPGTGPPWLARKMSDPNPWYVSQEGQQLGPYSGPQMMDFARQGNITPESMVWAEGMVSWQPAAGIEGLFPAPAPGFAHPPVKAASPGLFYGSIVGGLILMALFMILGSRLPAQATASGGALPVILLGMLFAGIGLLVIGHILALIVLHRAWRCLSQAGASVRPGAAVGLLFVPFFNLYWIFRAYRGFAVEWNRITTTHEETRLAPKMPEGLFLAFCILQIIFPPVGMILLFPVTGAMSKAINFIAFRPTRQGGFRFR